MHEAPGRDAFADEQFDLQLELEDLPVAATRDLARALWNDARAYGLDMSVQRRIDFSLRVFVALLRSPILAAEEADNRFAAWCEGFGLTAEQVGRDLSASLERARGRSRADGQ